MPVQFKRFFDFAVASVENCLITHVVCSRSSSCAWVKADNFAVWGNFCHRSPLIGEKRGFLTEFAAAYPLQIANVVVRFDSVLMPARLP